MAKGKNKDVCYRVVKFEVRLTAAQQQVLFQVNENLRTVWNEALAQRQSTYAEHIAPLYETLKSAPQDSDTALDVRRQIKEAHKAHWITLFDQINALTARRAGEPAFALIPRNWQEETLDALDGAMKSFGVLRKHGDIDARPPSRERDPGFFHEIPGRGGFKVTDSSSERTSFELLLPKLAPEMRFRFPIPEFQQHKLKEAVSIKKFTLKRDLRDVSKTGTYWVSLAYEVRAGVRQQFSADTAVYVSLGASSIGVVHHAGEEVIDLWRADKYWQPKIDAVCARLKACVKGSCAWHKRNSAKRLMQRRMAAQQQLDRKRINARLLRFGTHFVVTDLVVRSKPGKLADGKIPKRGGVLGLNWSAQNTGSIGYLVQLIEESVKLTGGLVFKHQLTLPNSPEKTGKDNKIWIARMLKRDFLAKASG